jgi:putative transcriptional regulator
MTNVLLLPEIMEEVPMGTVQSRVSEILGRRRMSITDLMRIADISYGTAWALYHGKQKSISFEVLAKLCENLEVEIGDLFVYIPDEDAPQNGDSQ